MKFEINQIEKYKVRIVHFKNLTFQLDTVDTALGIAGIENVCHKTRKVKKPLSGE